MRKLSFLACLTLILAGCQTIEERRAEVDRFDNARCLEFGAKRGTPGYTQCRIELERNRAIESQPRQTVLVGGGPVFGGGVVFGGPRGFCRPTPFGVRCY